MLQAGTEVLISRPGWRRHGDHLTFRQIRACMVKDDDSAFVMCELLEDDPEALMKKHKGDRDRWRRERISTASTEAAPTLF